MKKKVKNSIGRLLFVAVSVVLQIFWLVWLYYKLNEHSTWISAVLQLLVVITTLLIFSKYSNSALKLPWIILILSFPIFGYLMYVTFHFSTFRKKMGDRFAELKNELYPKRLKQDSKIMTELEELDYGIANQTRYILNYGNFPIYKNTDIEFHSEASFSFKKQLEHIEKAKKFIFMEYHAFEETSAFEALEKILIKKAAEGVDVRLLYDDLGSVGFLHPEFVRRMEKVGIKCRIFNPIVPMLHAFMNNRDHRKITVIDGEYGFTGGYNITDQYFNITHPYGYWKDTGIMLRGDAVKSLTVMFLEMWNSVLYTDKNFDEFFVQDDYVSKENGFIQPFADNPLDKEYVSESVYLNIIKNAKHEIYFTTPYLVITDEIIKELVLAAKRGVDVTIITPGIPDKKIVYSVTRSYYPELTRGGVKIYEYSPGFMHAKQCVIDREVAIVGTVNLDYRSLYFHFENGVYFCKCDAVQDVYNDFQEMIAVCEDVSEKSQNPHFLKRTWQYVLRIISPLL